MTTMITLKTSFEKARKGIISDIPAGWVVYSPATGRDAEAQYIRYATQEEAEARIPAIIAAIAARAAAAAETAKAEAIAKAEAAEAEAVRATLATDRQVSYILDLLRTRSTDDGFFSGPTTREQIAKMDRHHASAYISSLRGTY